MMPPLGPSLHLSWAELACHDAEKTPYPEAWRDRAAALASEFEALRETCCEEAGGPIVLRVCSAYRTPEHNAVVGGARRSQHVEGRALDLAPPKTLEFATFVEIARAQAKRRGIIHGLGVYTKKRFIHVDLRPAVGLVEWGD
jgi:hypothetical protein